MTSTTTGAGKTLAAEVRHKLIVYLDGARESEGPAVWLETIQALPAPSVGQLFDPLKWPADTFLVDAARKQLLFVVEDETRVFQEVCKLSDGPRHITVQRTLTVSPHGVGLDLEAAAAEAAAELERLQVLTWLSGDVARAMATELCGVAIDRCVDWVNRQLKAEAAQGIEAAPSAWHEAAAILQADGHLMRSTTLGELEQLAHTAMAALTRAERLALWLKADGGDVADLADGRTIDELMGLDPQSFRGCSLSESGERVVRSLVAQLLVAPVASTL